MRIYIYIINIQCKHTYIMSTIYFISDVINRLTVIIIIKHIWIYKHSSFTFRQLCFFGHTLHNGHNFRHNYYLFKSTSSLKKFGLKLLLVIGLSLIKILKQIIFLHIYIFNATYKCTEFCTHSQYFKMFPLYMGLNVHLKTTVTDQQLWAAVLQMNQQGVI